MLRKKICLLGTSAVGKTSLVRRFVEGIFSERYQTTIGVKISRKTVVASDATVELLLWDLNGEDRFQRLSVRYLRGASGYLLVADGTRPATLDDALALDRRAEAAVGSVPFVILLNKADLAAAWEVEDDTVEELRAKGWPVLLTSAKEGTGVDEAFRILAQQILQR